MEFGTGDIRMTAALSGGIGALCYITQMDGSYPFEKTRIRDEDLNFNAFMQAQEDDINGLREKIRTLGYEIPEEGMQKLLHILRMAGYV